MCALVQMMNLCHESVKCHQSPGKEQRGWAGTHCHPSQQQLGLRAACPPTSCSHKNKQNKQQAGKVFFNINISLF